MKHRIDFGSKVTVFCNNDQTKGGYKDIVCFCVLLLWYLFEYKSVI